MYSYLISVEGIRTCLPLVARCLFVLGMNWPVKRRPGISPFSMAVGNPALPASLRPTAVHTNLC